jgi:electron transport complex protein RnfC
MPCIRCGECARACPADLQPFELYWHSARAKLRPRTGIPPVRLHRVRLLRLRVPVAHSAGRLLPLRQERNLGARAREGAAADSARERFEFRNWRAEREKEEKAAKLAAKTAAGRQTAEKKVAPAAAAASDALPAAAEAARVEGTVAAPAAPSQTATADLAPPVTAETAPAVDPKKALIEAAIERARKQREAVSPKNTDNLSDAKRTEIAEIEARRAKIREMAKTHDEDGAS